MELGMGSKLKIGVDSIAELTSINGLELSADTVEKTVLDSPDNYREFIQGLRDGGEVSASGYFNPSDTNGQKALYDLFNNGNLQAFTILFPSTLGAEFNFSGIVTGLSTGIEMEDGISFEVTLKVSGKPSLGITASGGLTGLSLTGAGGTLTPTFNNGVFYYTFSGVTATSVTVTATAASHTLQLYVDGAFTQTLSSGSASSAIPVVLNTGKKLTILAAEVAKTNKIYEVVVVKTS